MSTIVLYSTVALLLILSWIKDKAKTKRAIKIGKQSLLKLLPSLIPIMITLGIILAVLSPQTVSSNLGEQSGILGVILGVVIGSVAFMPGFVAFPLGATLLDHGAGYPQIAGFISSLMAVGFISLGLEIRYFGRRPALIRNATALVASIVFVVLIWGIRL